MMNRMFGFAGACATAGVLPGPQTDADINMVAPSSEVQDLLYQLNVVRCLAIESLSSNTQFNMASLSFL